MNAPIAQVPIQRISGPGRLDSIDDLAIEEPLEIRLDFSGPDGPEHQTLSITMRTPGQDDELA
ncbi:MAG TPA: sulfurtransferase FdhD, partial [Polyangia bacterium]